MIYSSGISVVYNYILNLNCTVKPSTKDDYLEIKFYDRNQVEDTIVWGLSGGYLFFHSVLLIHYSSTLL